jgi:hypothetical protein
VFATLFSHEFAICIFLLESCIFGFHLTLAVVPFRFQAFFYDCLCSYIFISVVILFTMEQGGQQGEQQGGQNTRSSP